MAVVTCANADVLEGRIAMPNRGPITAELRLDVPVARTGPVTLAASGGFSYAATVIRGGVDVDAAKIVIVGGAGGLARPVQGYFRSAQLRDVLGAIAKAAGETISSAIAPAILGIAVPAWTLGRCSARRALDEAAGFAQVALGQPVTWRMLGDGSVWMGVESWPAMAMPAGADLLERAPAERRYMLGVETLSLVPGVNLDGIGQLVAVEHFVGGENIRSIAWI